MIWATRREARTLLRFSQIRQRPLASMNPVATGKRQPGHRVWLDEQGMSNADIFAGVGHGWQHVGQVLNISARCQEF
jgi:hypothetical protein